jgi:hypothetical protein
MREATKTTRVVERHLEVQHLKVQALLGAELLLLVGFDDSETQL